MTRASDNGSNGPVQRICVLGSTGSIGTQTLDVARLFPGRIRVEILTARSNMAELARQVDAFGPSTVVVGDATAARRFRTYSGTGDVRVLVGEDGLCEVAASPEIDTVVASLVGFAGLAPVLAALGTGKKVALANKETLVVAGDLVRRVLDADGGILLPVDSEHSAIFQCLLGEPQGAIEELILTASGGPFRTRPIESFPEITLREALAHPNWSMGEKITIDSASMMNKGLEVIEAHWIFDVPADRIRVLVHPQSVIHSMVTFCDGSTKAQLGVPDMKVPIQYALTYPDRWPAPHPRLDWSTLATLDFEPPDRERFPCLDLAYRALERGGTAPAVLNAANEQAVALFLREQIRFTDIAELIEGALESLADGGEVTLEKLVAVDGEARANVLQAAG